MTNPTIHGYLEDPYLSDPYLGGTVKDYYGIQSNLVINRRKALAAQAMAMINKTASNGLQVQHIIAGFPKAMAEQALLTLLKKKEVAAQLQRTIADAVGLNAAQLEAVIIRDYAIGFQINLKTKVEVVNGVQVTVVIPDTVEFIGTQTLHNLQKQKASGAQTRAMIKDSQKTVGAQTRMFVVDKKDALGSQSRIVINAFDDFGAQINADIKKTSEQGTQLDRSIIDHTEATGIEVRFSKTFPHIKCEKAGYLQQGYLEDPYLVAGYCVDGAVQVEFIMKKQPAYGIQAQRTINAWIDLASQVRNIIQDRLHSLGAQITLYRAFKMGVQFRAVLYNTTNLRVLYNFPSRGTSGLNWTASSTETGDFSANNLNTDIVEQRWQSAAGVKLATLVCDTEVLQGVTIDTFAMLNHNLTTQASLSLEGSNDPLFTSINDTILLEVKKASQDIYYIAPQMPTIQSRYYRITITDNNNPDGCLKVGTIVFGNSIILQGEIFTDVVRKKKTHFSDKVTTEGFTSVSNDRALKKSISLDFQRIAYARGNYNNMQTIFDGARTSLKCLWIPDPKYAERFAVFGKLSSIPEESHQNMGDGADFVDFSIEVDEAL